MYPPEPTWVEMSDLEILDWIDHNCTEWELYQKRNGALDRQYGILITVTAIGPIFRTWKHFWMRSALIQAAHQLYERKRDA